MKKIFLPLVALMGLGAALLFPSCGSGNGKDKEGPSSALSGMLVEIWPNVTPSLQVQFNHAVSSHVCNATYTAGDDSPEMGLYTVDTYGKDAGNWVIKGSVNIYDDGVYNNSGFRQLVGCNDDQEIGIMQSFLIYMWFDPTGRYAVKSSVNIQGEMTGDGGNKPFSMYYPVAAKFQVMHGKLQTEYLEDKPMDFNDVPTPDGM